MKVMTEQFVLNGDKLTRTVFARTFAPMIRPLQMTCRDLVLTASDYSATAPGAQSTTL